jgi:hypothetical protein
MIFLLFILMCLRIMLGYMRIVYGNVDVDCIMDLFYLVLMIGLWDIR